MAARRTPGASSASQLAHWASREDIERIESDMGELRSDLRASQSLLLSKIDDLAKTIAKKSETNWGIWISVIGVVLVVMSMSAGLLVAWSVLIVAPIREEQSAAREERHEVETKIYEICSEIDVNRGSRSEKEKTLAAMVSRDDKIQELMESLTGYVTTRTNEIQMDIVKLHERAANNKGE